MKAFCAACGLVEVEELACPNCKTQLGEYEKGEAAPETPKVEHNGEAEWRVTE